MTQKKTMLFTLYITVFLSTGAIIDFMVLGSSRQIQIQNDSSLRLILWLPLYLSFLIFSIQFAKVIMSFLIRYKAFLAILLLTLTSVIWSDVPFISAYSAIQLLLITTFAISVGNSLPLRELLEKLHQIFSLIIVLSVIAVLAVPEYGTSEYAGEVSFRGIFIEKNRLGQILVYYFALSFAFFRFTFPSIVVFMAAVFLLFGNGSATSLVLILLLPILFKATQLFHGRKEVIARNTLGIFLLSLVCILILFATFELLLEVLGKDPTLTGRTELWKFGLISISERPITGFGYNAFWPSSSAWGGEYLQLLLKWGPRSMHNGWFELILQLGFMGAVLGLLLFFLYFKLNVVVLEQDFTASARVALILLFVIFVWSNMQHILFRHQALTHFMFTLIFSALSRHAYLLRKQGLKHE